MTSSVQTDLRPYASNFWCKVEFEPNTGCWLWNASHNSTGYALFSVGGKSMLAHRYSLCFMAVSTQMSNQILTTCVVTVAV